MKRMQPARMIALTVTFFCFTSFALAENLNQFGVGFGQGFTGPPTSQFKSMQLSSTHIKMVIAPDNQTIWGYSTQTGKWDSFKLPSDHQAEIIPIIGENIVACVTGDLLLAYGSEAGKWHSVKIDPAKIKHIKQPAGGLGGGGAFFQIKDEDKNQKQVLFPVGPTISSNFAGFVNGNKAYATGTSSTKWQVIEFPAGETPVIGLANDFVQAHSSNYLYMFSKKTNKWTGIKLKSNEGKPDSIERAK